MLDVMYLITKVCFSSPWPLILYFPTDITHLVKLDQLVRKKFIMLGCCDLIKIGT